MSKEDMKQRYFYSYADSIEKLKSIVRQNEVDQNRELAQLKVNADLEQSKLEAHIEKLQHLKQIQKLEYEMWQLKIQALDKELQEVEQQIESQAISLANSKAELARGLRMIDLSPSSRAEDYLQNTSVFLSSSENLQGDWEKVGQQLASVFFKNTQHQK